MAIYRKKPSLVEAYRLSPDNLVEVFKWVRGREPLAPVTRVLVHIDEEDSAIAVVGDWIVKEANGSFNVYTDEAFRLMHEVG